MNEEYADLVETWGVNAVFAKAVVKNRLKEAVKSSFGSVETCLFTELLDGMVEYGVIYRIIKPRRLVLRKI